MSNTPRDPDYDDEIDLDEDTEDGNVDADFVAASNLDVAQRLPNDQIEPVETGPDKSDTNSPATRDTKDLATTTGSEDRRDPNDGSNVHYSNDPNTTSNTGNAGEHTAPAGATQTTPVQTELDAAAMTSARQPGAGGDATAPRSGFGALNNVDNK